MRTLFLVCSKTSGKLSRAWLLIRIFFYFSFLMKLKESLFQKAKRAFFYFYPVVSYLFSFFPLSPFACFILFSRRFGLRFFRILLRELPPKISGKDEMRKLADFVFRKNFSRAYICEFFYILGEHELALESIFKSRFFYSEPLLACFWCAKILFELAEFERAKFFIAAIPFSNNESNEITAIRWQLFLLCGELKPALFFLREQQARQSEELVRGCAHQNMAARYPRNYIPLRQDIESGEEGLLYDAYNFLGQRMTHIGEGQLGPPLYAQAFDAQKKLRKKPPFISRELSGFLRARGCELDNLVILPWEWVSQVGHLGMLDILLRMGRLGWWSGFAVLLAPEDRVANFEMLKLFRGLVTVLVPGVDIKSELAGELFSLQRYYGLSFNAWEMPDGQVVPWQEAGAKLMYRRDIAAQYHPLQDAFDRQLERAQEIKREESLFRAHWGMGPEDWYVCLHFRDASFYGDIPGTGQSHRNTQVDPYLNAIEYITQQGGWVIQMGGSNAPALPKMHRVIHYGHSRFKTESMDLQLVRNCFFFIGTTSGLTNLAVSFNKHCALVNCITPDAQLWHDRVRFALKPIMHQRRMLTQKELTSAPWRWRQFQASVLRRYGAQYLENSADEILETVKEVEELARLRECHEEPDLIIERWRKELVFPEYYGAGLPSLYYLKKHQENFL